MGLSNDIVSQFVELTKKDEEVKNGNTVYGTVKKLNNINYVQIDGSEVLTPVSSTAYISDGERVTVMIKDHQAIVTGNITAPATRTSDVDIIVGDQIAAYDTVITKTLKADYASIEHLEANYANIKELEAEYAKITTLEAKYATIENLKANYATIENLKANYATIENLKANYATIENLKANYATISHLEANYASIQHLQANYIDANTIKADYATIGNLEANYAKIESLDTNYANIDFANIGMAAVETLFVKSGIVKDMVVGDQHITGELVGVTIKGDLIEGNTIVAEKLVVKGSDGLYYKLNTDGMTVEAEQTDYNSLNGSIITAKSITASKVNVKDLVAFNATIGGFNLTDSAIYSGVKSSVNNTTSGVYLDSTGQIAFGDATNYLKFFKDTDGKWKLNISASTIKMSSSSQNVEDAIKDVVGKVEKTVRNVISHYAKTASSTVPPTTGWSPETPQWVDGSYIWHKTITTYVDGTTSESNPVCITGAKGSSGSSGNGVKSITNYYLASSLSTGVTTSTSGWTTTIQTMTTTNKYLWNYEVISYTNGQSTTTNPVIIGVYGTKGETGVGIKSIAEKYAVSSSNTTTPTTWYDTIQTMTTTNKYLWNYEIITYTDNKTVNTAKRVIGVYGDKGDKGDKGDSGVGIKTVDVEYYLSTSNTTLSGGTWSTTAPAWVDGKYMWSRTKTVNTSNTTTYSDPVCITGGKGSTGPTGQGVESIIEEYYLSSSKTTQTGGSWVTTPPEWIPGKYIWTRSKITYKNPASTYYTKAICDSSWDAINQIDIGGRNLALTGSISPYGSAGYTTVNNDDFVKSGKSRFSRTAVLNEGPILDRYVSYEAGQDYTISFKLRTISGNVTYIHLFNGCNHTDGEVYIDNVYSGTLASNINIPTDTNYHKIIIHFKGGTKDRGDITDTHTSHTILQPMKGDSSVSYVMEINNFKIEKGNKQTDWSPAPEDISDVITTVTNRVTDVESEITKESIVDKITEVFTTKEESAVIEKQLDQNRQNIRCNNIGAKINYASFTVTNQGKMYLHGYDSDNNPSDIDGSIYWNGKTVTVKKGVINPNSNFGIGVDVYIFVNITNTSIVNGGYYDTVDKVWKYKQLIGGTTSGTFTPIVDHVAIGMFNMSSTQSFNFAFLFDNPQAFRNIAVGVGDVLTRIKTAEQKITSEAIVSTVTESTKWTNLNSTANAAKTTADSALSAANTANSGVSGLAERVKTAEEKITADAIVSTVTDSEEWTKVTKGYVDNFSLSGNLDGWSGMGTAGKIVKSTEVTNYLSITTSGNIQGTSDKFEIDPTKTYKVAIMVYVPFETGTGSWYFGVNALNAGGTNIGVYLNKGTTLNTNPYFHQEVKATKNGSWRTFEGYIYGSSVELNDNTPSGNCNNYMKFSSNTKYLQIRILHYRSSSTFGDGSSGSMYFAHPTISPVDGVIVDTVNRLKQAELKITSSAIVSTVTSSTNWSTLNSTASTAKTTADAAKSTANTAKTTADTAKTTADTAKTTANTAKTTADSAKNVADVVNRQMSQNNQNIRCNNIGAKINYASFTGANEGEMYLHGYDSSGNPTDTDGSIYWGGKTLTISKGVINPNSDFPFNTQVIIFINTTVTNVYGAYYNTTTKKWAYKQLIGGTSSNTSWTPSVLHVAIGEFNMASSESFNYAFMYEKPILLMGMTVSEMNLASRIDSAEQKITSTAIINTVQSTITAAKNDAISSANSSTDTKLKSYVTTSSLKQTTDKITASFTSSGAFNMVENSTGLNSISNGWNNTGNNSSIIKAASSTSALLNSGYYLYMDRDGDTSTAGTAAVSRRFKLKPNTTYTISGYVLSHAKTRGMTFTVRTSDTVDFKQVDDRASYDATYTVYNGKTPGWSKKSLTFTTGASVKSGVVWITHLGYDSTDTGNTANRVYWSEIMLTLGDVAQPWTPHPNEVYTGSTVIDATGVTINNGAIRIKNKAGSEVLSTDTSGNLKLKGSIDINTSSGQQLYVNTNDSKYPVLVSLNKGTFTRTLAVTDDFMSWYDDKAWSGTNITPSSVSSNNVMSKGDMRSGTSMTVGTTLTTGSSITSGGSVNVKSGHIYLSAGDPSQQLRFNKCSSDARLCYFYNGANTSTTRVGLYDYTGGYAVWRYVNDDEFYIDVPLTAKAAVFKGHVTPGTTRSYWLGTNSPDRQWKGVCCEGGTVGASDIRSKENIRRLDGSLVTFDELNNEVKEYELSYLNKANTRAISSDYYDFIKDRFKPTYYNYKLTESMNDNNDALDPESEYKMLKNIGFIAQDYDLQTDKVAQEFIFENDSGELAYNHMSYVTVGMIALQEATRKIEQLENKNKELEDRLKILEDLIQLK